MNETALPSCEVLGVPVFVGDVSAAAEAVIDLALEGGGGYAVMCNVHVLMTARGAPEVLRAVEDARVVFPDGAPVAWLQGWTGARAASRVGGPDLMPAVLDRGRARGLRHAFFGSTPQVVDALTERLRTRFPGVDLTAAVAPAPGEEDDEALLGQVAAARPHLVWTALGAPKQELWMRRRAAAFAPALVIGVGAAFDFAAGTKRRAPAWMQRTGLEWLHRLGSERRRLFRRYATTNAAFVVTAGAHLARRWTAWP